MAEWRCSICERVISRGWYCYKCYQAYKADILVKSPWTRYLQNLEMERRRTKQVEEINLGAKYNISDDGEIVYRNGMRHKDGSR